MANPPSKPNKIASALTNREIMAYIALFASILGSAVLTAFAVWVIWIIWQGGWALDTAPQRISILSKALVISLGGSLIVLITLGFVISRRTIKVTKDGFVMQSDGAADDNDDDEEETSEEETPEPTPSPTVVAKTTQVTETS